jgi:hypothetical protein
VLRFSNFLIFRIDNTTHAPATLLSSARLSAADRARHLRQQRLKRPLALPKMWWTDAGHREAYCCRHPTPFSTCPGRCCGMKRLSTTRNSCVRQHAQSLCASPIYKSPLSTFSSYHFARMLHLLHPFLPQGRLPCSLAQSRRIWAPHLPTIEFA